ncbi:MAG: hypothetical protein HGB30_07935 [Holophagaceae bacterium]|nr:hypothetical protein [Holophagaceae bacterium]
MADANRTPLLDRAAALLAGPFLLGRQALSLAFLTDRETPEAPALALQRIPVTPPEHAIKRRG